MTRRPIITILIVLIAVCFFVSCDSSPAPVVSENTTSMGPFKIGSKYFSTLAEAVSSLSKSTKSTKSTKSSKPISASNTIYLTKDVSDAGAVIETDRRCLGVRRPALGHSQRQHKNPL